MKTRIAKIYRSRIRKVQSLLRQEPVESALLVGSAPQAVRSRDTSYSFRQDSDFFYLTGSEAQDVTLLIRDSGKPILFSPKVDKLKLVWDGAGPNSAMLARVIGAERIQTSSPVTEIKQRMKGVGQLFHQNLPGSTSWSVAQSLMSLPFHQRRGLPSRFSHVEVLLQELRLYKNPHEVQLIKHAAAITNTTLFELLQIITPGVSEAEIAGAIDYQFAALGGRCAFPSIVAAGPSAAVLHYHALSRRLKSGDMLLLDIGAEFGNYASDITRVIPVDGAFTPLQSEIYYCVLEAQLAAIKRVRHGVRMRAVYDAAAKVLTEGLKDFGILRGPTSKLMAKGAFKPYFPHGIGHSLGLDVHDVGDLRGNNEPRLKKGMVITIEPGLYFQKKTRKIPVCGVRIEDDVLVTQNGHKVISAGFPKEMNSE